MLHNIPYQIGIRSAHFHAELKFCRLSIPSKHALSPLAEFIEFIPRDT